MDGNRTHPGRLSSAPQTVLKTAFLTSIEVRGHPLPIESRKARSARVRCHPSVCTRLAVILAVMRPGDSHSQGSRFDFCGSTVKLCDRNERRAPQRRARPAAYSRVTASAASQNKCSRPELYCQPT